MQNKFRGIKSFAFMLVLSILLPSISPLIDLSPRVAEATDANGCDFYAAPLGSQTSPSGQLGSGTLNNPWDLQTALNKKSVVTSGKTLCLRGGVYYGIFTSSIEGTATNPTTVRSFPGEWAVIDDNLVDTLSENMTATTGFTRCKFSSGKKWPNGTHVIVDNEVMQVNNDTVTYPDALTCLRARTGTTAVAHSIGAPVRPGEVNIFIVNGSYVHFRDFEVRNSDPSRIKARTIYNPDGTWTVTHSSLRPLGIYVFGVNNKFINLIIRNTGDAYGIWSTSANTEIYGNFIYNNGWISPLRGHGHGVYAQNKNGYQYIHDNVFFNNFFVGLQIFGTQGAPLSGFRVSGNLFLNDGTIFEGVGGNAAKDIEFTKNYFYGEDSYVSNPPPTQISGKDCNVLNCSADELANYVKITNNYGFSENSTQVTDGTVKKNPVGLDIFYQPNKEQLGRGLIYVYNYDKKDSVSVSVSKILKDQSRLNELANKDYEIYDIQNLAGEPVKRGTYNAGVIDLDMRLTKLEPVEGYAINSQTYPTNRNGHLLPVLRHSSKRFNAFLVVPKGTFGPGLYRPAADLRSDTTPPGFSFFLPVTDLPLGESNTSTPRYDSSAPINFTTKTSPISVSGYASDAAGIKDMSWSNDRGGSGIITETIAYWQRDIPLQNGLNKITFTVKDNTGLTSSKILKICLGTCTVTPPVPDTIVPPTTINPSTKFILNDQVISNTSLNVRSQPLINASVVPGSPVAKDTQGTIQELAIPEKSGNTTYQWWKVSYKNGVTGWSAEDFLNKYIAPITPPIVTPPTNDTTAPTIKLIPPTAFGGNYTANASPFTVSGTATDNVGVTEIRVTNTKTGASIVANGTTSWSANVELTSGINILSVRAVDKAGNSVVGNVNVTYTAPQTPVIPSASFKSSTYTFTSGGTVKLEFTTSNGSTANITPGNCTVDAKKADQICSFTAPTVLSPVSTTYTLKVTSSTGNVASTSTTVTINPTPPIVTPPTNDTTAPTIKLIPPTAFGGNYTANASPFTVSGTATDNVGVTEIRVTNTKTGASIVANGTTSWSANVELTSGINILSVRAVDKAGNSVVGSINVTYVPSETSTYLEAESGASGINTSTVFPAYNGSGYFTDTIGNGAETTLSFTPTKTGIHYLWGKVYAQDNGSTIRGYAQDSFHVKILDQSNNTISNFDIYDDLEGLSNSYNKWTWTKVNGRGCTNSVTTSCSNSPLTLNPRTTPSLTAGAIYKIVFKIRDANSKIDRVFITSNSSAVPNEGVVLGTNTDNNTLKIYELGTVTLQSGSNGEAVKELQRFLNDTLSLGLVVDGKLGPKTIAVIKQWQLSKGLIPDGLVGAKTKAKMNGF